MNNKGFAITGIIYGLMLLFIVLVTSFLTILIGRNKRIDALLEGAYSSVEYKNIKVSYKSDGYFYESEGEGTEEKKITVDIEGLEEGDDKDIFITSKKAKYTFTINNDECIAFFPDDVMIITNKIKKDSTATDQDLFYYKLKVKNDYSDMSVFEKVECINE